MGLACVANNQAVPHEGRIARYIPMLNQFAKKTRNKEMRLQLAPSETFCTPYQPSPTDN